MKIRFQPLSNLNVNICDRYAFRCARMVFSNSIATRSIAHGPGPGADPGWAGAAGTGYVPARSVPARSIPARSPLDPRSARLARSVTHSPGPGPGPSPGRSVAVARSLDTRLARSRWVGRSVGQAGGHPGRPDRMLSPACDAKDPRHHASARTCIVHMHKGKGPGAGQGEHTCSLAELGRR